MFELWKSTWTREWPVDEGTKEEMESELARHEAETSEAFKTGQMMYDIPEFYVKERGA